jgi:hypothetical protein
MRRRAALQTIASLGGLGATALGLKLRLGQAAEAQPPLQRGVALGLFSEDPLWSYEPLLREIRELGASHVSLTAAYYQEHGGSTSIYVHPRFSAPDLTIVRTMQEARALGLKVMLFPIVRLEKPRSDKEWRGTLAPDDAAAWWKSYESRMVHLAQLAQREGAAVFSVGSELSTLDRKAQRPRWQQLVAKVRQQYRGLLTYSGNWDHYDDVGMYDLVDLAGLCAYFPLAERGYTGFPALEKLTEAWRKKRGELESFATRTGRPMLLTEVGYLSQRGAAAWPWQEGATEPVDLEDQRRCFQAFADVWRGAASLRGVYFWNYYGWGGRQSSGYTPRHKPAGQEIERYFAAEAQRPPE